MTAPGRDFSVSSASRGRSSYDSQGGATQQGSRSKRLAFQITGSFRRKPNPNPNCHFVPSWSKAASLSAEPREIEFGGVALKGMRVHKQTLGTPQPFGITRVGVHEMTGSRGLGEAGPGPSGGPGRKGLGNFALQGLGLGETFS